MGLSIHYSGKIKNVSMIEEMSIEVADICRSLEWDHTIINIPESEIKGIVFAPKECELACFTFTKDGRLISPLTILSKRFLINEELANELNYMCHTKTQFAGPDAHMALIKLIRYVSEKYFDEFNLYDEGLYWETSDKETLFEKFDFLNAAIDAVASALTQMKRIPGESSESVIARIEKILRDKFENSRN